MIILSGCSDPPPVAPVSTVLAPADAPKIYGDFSEVAPLFNQQNDTTYLINFWATWCKPCLEELPLLQQLEQEYREGPLRVILVSLDTEPGAIARIPGYLSRRGINLPTIVLTDERQGWMRDLDDKWNGALPTTVIYRNNLRYIYRRNFISLPDVLAAVEPLVG
ncbi:TlpA disulfide reductase family protein [Lewinella sp. JB7]|uniref:TlpA family protein disulfide reductase n=1 Tax=Lewinella sp. JB7 TaxID=2962887 RepID=UPI0020C99DB0|nr:TlpA disulfide reductase family protein [Lewinella sp. JB7]MCP9235916.1 TlpA family protein disulfide reductase [Lewinella sp. JB7]